LRQTDLHVAIFTSADADEFAHDDFRRSIVERRDVNYQPVYLWFCHCFREVSLAVTSNRASASKTAMELDAVGQAVARSKSILQWNRLRAKTW
jgi:hypothetical protein